MKILKNIIMLLVFAIFTTNVYAKKVENDTVTFMQVVTVSNDVNIASNINVSGAVNGTNSVVTNFFMGNLGIGTNNPAQKLHVLGNAQIDGVLSNATLYLNNIYGTNAPSSPDTNMITGSIIFSNFASSSDFAYLSRTNHFTGSTNWFTGGGIQIINSLGTGTAADNATLALQSTNRNALFSLNIPSSSVGPYQNAFQFLTGSVVIGQIQMYNNMDTSMIFKAAGNVERMRLNAIGLGVGITNPFCSLVVTGQVHFGPVGENKSNAFHVVSDPGTGSRVEQHTGIFDNYSSDSTILMGRKALGGLASPSNVQKDYALMAIQGGGWTDGGFTTRRGEMAILASQNWSGTSNGTHIYFRTTPTNTATPVERMRIDHNGNVGIGTTAPRTLLHADSSAAAPQILASGYSLAGAAAGGYQGTLQLGTNNLYCGRVDYDAVGSTVFYLDNTYDNAGAKTKIRMRTAGTPVDAITVVGTGNVGIGTNAPAYLLELGASSPAIGLSSYNANAGARNWGLQLNYSSWGDFAIMVSTGRSTAIATQVMTLKPSGNVGIGTVSPATNLDVVGGINMTGKLGIGSANPVFPVHVYVASNATQQIGGCPTSNDHNSDLSQLRFGLSWWGGYGSHMTSRQVWNGSALSDYELGFSTYLGGSGNSVERMIIKGNGNVGIGTLTPTESLSVSSTVSVIANGSVSPSALADRVILYSTNASSAVLYCINGAGTRKQLSSHNSDNDMVEHDINEYAGEDRSINIMQLTEAVQEISKVLSAQGNNKFNKYTNILTRTVIPKKDFRADRKKQAEEQGYIGDEYVMPPLPTFLRDSQKVFDSVHPDWKVDQTATYKVKAGKHRPDPLFTNDNSTKMMNRRTK